MISRFDGLNGVAGATFGGVNSLAPAMAWGFNGHLGKAAIVGAASASLLLLAWLLWRRHHGAQSGNILRLFVSV